MDLYYTDDITASSPTWYRFSNGLPHSMIWDMQIDRGSTTLALFTRGRGAYVWPLPLGPVPVPVPTSIVSRKTHGGAGTFDINLPATGNPGIEDRTGAVAGAHQIIVTFANAVTVSAASVSSGTGSVASFSVSGAQVTVNLTGVTNAQVINVKLTNVNDGVNAGDVTMPMAVLLGDTNGSGTVTASDVGQTKAQSGQTTTDRISGPM